MGRHKKQSSQESILDPEVETESEVENETQPKSDTLAVTAVFTSVRGEPVEPNDTVIKFKVAYPEGYKGIRHWEDGSVIETSKESALLFEKMELGKIC